MSYLLIDLYNLIYILVFIYIIDSLLNLEDLMMSTLMNSIKDKTLSTEMLRVYFGLALFFKGIYFIGNMTDLFQHISHRFHYVDFIFAHYVVLAHIVGGLFVALGLFTRWACLANIPVLFLAIVFVKLQTGLFSIGAEFELAVMVLMLLIYFTIQGSGKNTE